MMGNIIVSIVEVDLLRILQKSQRLFSIMTLGTSIGPLVIGHPMVSVRCPLYQSPWYL